MNEVNKSFLGILKAALGGEKADPGPREQWDQLFHLAAIHSVLPLVCEAVHEAVCRGDAAYAAGLRRQVRSQVILQTLRTDEFLALARKFSGAGLRPLVVKGIICRNLYPKPDHRPSSDEDVLIPPEDFERFHQVMTEFGLHTTLDGEAMAPSYEVPYRKPGSPLYIELHKHLFPPQSDAYGDWNRFFTGIFDRAVPEDIQGQTLYTPEPTDHLFYLLCHSLKHFLHSGFGIRQVCDIILYANRYGSRVDWALLLEHCRAVRADKFAAALFRIGGRYLTFDPELADYPRYWREIAVDEGAMLEDILCAGVYGGSDLSRKHSSTITLDAVAAQKQEKRAPVAALSSAFPPARKLEGRYPYLKKHPYLLPAAWCSRLWTYARETNRREDSSAADALKIGAERIALMKQYGILK